MATGKGTRDGLVASPGTRIGIAVARFNEDITVQLRDGARAALAAAKVELVVRSVGPGRVRAAVGGASTLTKAGCDAVVALGCVIRGDTGHYDFVAGECASGLQRVQLDTGKPVVFGVLTTENHLPSG